MMNSSAPSANDGSGNSRTSFPNKRRRIPLACNQCRQRKSRCDGGRPSCSACSRKGIYDCLYEDSSLITQRYISSLERRLERLEQGHKPNQSPSSGGEYDQRESRNTSALPQFCGSINAESVSKFPTAMFSRRHFTPSQTDRESGAILQHEKCSPSQSVQRGRQSPDPCSDSIATDALVIVPLSENGSERGFRGSTLTALVHLVIKVSDINGTSGILPELHFCAGRDISSQLTEFHCSPPEIDPATITRRVADSFIDCFWEVVHPIFPVLHRPRFTVLYERLWLSESYGDTDNQTPSIEDPILPALFNIVFAIGCQLSNIILPSKRAVLANQFYQLSRKQLPIDILDSASIMSVQFLLLTGIYLQSTQYSSRCWNSIGLAVRVAQGLGLHIDRNSEYGAERRMKQRVWYCCIILDRLMALTFGRSSMIPSEPSSLSLMIDESDLMRDSEDYLENQQLSRVDFFDSSVKLFDIMEEVLSITYRREIQTGSSRPWWSSVCLWDIMRLNSKIDELIGGFSVDLPMDHAVHLDMCPGSDWMTRQASVFRSRALYVRSLLLRPLVILAAQHRTDIRQANSEFRNVCFEESVALKACTLCMSTVHSLVAHIHDQIASHSHVLIWHTVHYIFACGILLVAAHLCPVGGVEFSRSSLQTSLSHCTAILGHYKSQISSAAYAMRVLEVLHQRVNIVEGHDHKCDSQGLGMGHDSTKDPDRGSQIGVVTNDDIFNVYDHEIGSLSSSWFQQHGINLDWTESF